MTVVDFWSKLAVGGMTGWIVALLIILLSLIEISPLRLNPWDKIFTWLGRRINGETQKKLDDLQKQIQEMWIYQHRQAILNFSREVKDGVEHDSEAWTNILNTCADYEAFIDKAGVPNGVVQLNMKYLRDTFMKLSVEHRV